MHLYIYIMETDSFQDFSTSAARVENLHKGKLRATGPYVI